MSWPDWDLRLLLSLNGIESGLLTSLMRTVTDFDNWAPLLLLAAVALLWMGRNRPYRSRGEGRLRTALAARNPRIVLLCLLLSAGLADLAAHAVKEAVGRTRPCFDEEVAPLVTYRGDVHGHDSFPSSHAANSASLAATASLAYPPLAIPAIAAALLVGVSRVYLGVHYPLDVLVGWATGAAAALLVWLLLRRAAGRHGLVGFTCRFRFRQFCMIPPPDPPWERVGMKSADGFRMDGYLLRGGGRLAVMVHGLHGDTVGQTVPGTVLAERGFSVLTVPLRGHDGHPVATTTGGPAEALDVLGALEWARGAGYRRDGTVLVGTSMGAVACIKAAGLLGGPAAVVALAPYDDFFRSASRRLGRVGTTALRILLPRAAARGLSALSPSDYGRAAGGTRLFLVHGELDRISPPSAGRTIVQGMDGGVMLPVGGAGHPAWTSPGTNTDALIAAVESALAAAGMLPPAETDERSGRQTGPLGGE